MKLRFLKSQGYNGEIVRAGSVRSDISEFWAQRFIEQGIAIVEEAPKKEKKTVETVEVETPAPKKKTAKRKK
jgi:hypothetical protein